MLVFLYDILLQLYYIISKYKFVVIQFIKRNFKMLSISV